MRRHRAIVLVLLLVGLGLGWVAGSSQPTTWSSTARVLINPTVGNPFAPAPSSVRQDELTSLETEAQVAGSAEVLEAVAAANPPVTVGQIQRGLVVTVPPNSQILELTYTTGDARTAEQVTDSLARLCLDNRDRRAADVTADRISKVEEQTEGVVDDLRAATAAAQTGTAAQRQFQSELAAALRNQLVSLRAQRSYLENSDAPAGSVISPASAAAKSGGLVLPVMLAGGALLGLALGAAVAVVRERVSGRVRAVGDVAAAGVPVLVGSSHGPWRPFHTREHEQSAELVRRLRAAVVRQSPTPEVVAVAPASPGDPGPAVAQALAESFARAGNRVVLVTGAHADDKRGMADVLVHERTRIAELLRPGSDPLLKLLPWGLTDRNRERLSEAALREALAPLVDAGHVVVMQAPDATSVEGEAILGAADLALVVVTPRRTPTRAVTAIGSRLGLISSEVLAVVVDEGVVTAGPEAATADDDSSPTRAQVARARR